MNMKRKQGTPIMADKMKREHNTHNFNCPIWIRNDPKQKCECMADTPTQSSERLAKFIQTKMKAYAMMKGGDPDVVTPGAHMALAQIMREVDVYAAEKVRAELEHVYLGEKSGGSPIVCTDVGGKEEYLDDRIDRLTHQSQGSKGSPNGKRPADV